MAQHLGRDQTNYSKGHDMKTILHAGRTATSLAMTMVDNDLLFSIDFNPHLADKATHCWKYFVHLGNHVFVLHGIHLEMIVIVFSIQHLPQNCKSECHDLICTICYRNWSIGTLILWEQSYTSQL